MRPSCVGCCSIPALLVATSTGVSVTSFGSAMIATFVIGIFSTLLHTALLVLLTLPVTLLTLGLFSVRHQRADVLGRRPHARRLVAGFTAALIGSLIYSVCGIVIDAAMERLFAPRGSAA